MSSLIRINARSHLRYVLAFPAKYTAAPGGFKRASTLVRRVGEVGQPTIRRYAPGFRGRLEKAQLDSQILGASDVRPIIINGAGPAGLILANMLRIDQIPFEICERDVSIDRMDAGRNGSAPIDLDASERRTSRSYRVILEPGTIRLLKGELKIKDLRWFLISIASNRQAVLSSRDNSYDQPLEIDMRNFVRILARGIQVNYYHNLHHEGYVHLFSPHVSNILNSSH